MKTVGRQAFARMWMEECGRMDPLFPEAIGRHWRSRGTLFNEDGRLIYRQGNTRQELARYCGLRGVPGSSLLINGAGFVGDLMEAQAEVRLAAAHTRGMGILNHLLVPYPALESARINLDSIRRVFSLPARWVQKGVPIVQPPRRVWPVVPNWSARDFVWEGRTWRVVSRWGNGGAQLVLQTMWRPPNGALAWHDVRNGQILTNIHRLGASLFTGLGPDNLEHAYLSAFDEQEDDMYFLAQLPDGKIPKTYREAIEELQPEIVRRAVKQKKAVYRQGDIFAIETDLTMDDLRRRPGFKMFARENVLMERRIKPFVSRETAFLHGIYGTGHTATMKIETDDGTYISGQLFHDPCIELPGRRREHETITLSSKKWHLCVRNTVPRDPVLIEEGR